MTNTTTGKPIRLDLVSDVVCPWCIVGFRQFQLAVQEIENSGTPVEITWYWHPFELNPRMPEEGQELGEHIQEKYGSSPEQSQANRDKLKSLGQSLGFEFSFYDGMRIHNTFKAHQLLHWAGEQGKQTELKLALFDTYFTQQKNPDDETNLVNAAAKAGLDAEQALNVLQEQRYADDVRSVEELWLKKGIQGVPAFVFNEKYLVSGAQGKDTFVQILNKLVAGAEL